MVAADEAVQGGISVSRRFVELCIDLMGIVLHFLAFKGTFPTCLTVLTTWPEEVPCSNAQVMSSSIL
jgi:hypothetical protein